MEWDALDRKLHKVLKTIKKYPKGFHPATLDPIFLAATAKLANGFLVTPNTDHGYVDFSRRLSFCKEHKDVNEVLLKYAATTANFVRYQDGSHHFLVHISCRTDTDNFVPNPVDNPKSMPVFPIKKTSP